MGIGVMIVALLALPVGYGMLQVGDIPGIGPQGQEITRAEIADLPTVVPEEIHGPLPPCCTGRRATRVAGGDGIGHR